MSLAKIFGLGKGKKEVPTTQEAIQKLRSTEEMLAKKTDHLEKKIEQELAVAKKKGMKDKRGALAALRRKKRLEKNLLQIDGTLSTIEFQREALENANTNTEVLKNMQYAAKALQSAHQQLNVDDVHDMMDDIAEQTDLANEISNAISSPVGFGDPVDDDDLMAELEELEQEGLDESLLNIPAPSLPDVPTKDLPEPVRARATEEDDDGLKELQAWAS